jgi:hypothetical protein
MSRLLGSLGAAVLLGLILVGCGSSARSHVHGDTLIVLDRSMGGVALRERREDAERILGDGHLLGAQDQKPREPRLHFEAVRYPNGLQVGYVSENATARSVARGRVAYLLTRSPRFRTKEGVHVGSTVAELRSIKGVICGNLLNLDCQHGGRIHNQPGTLFKLSAPHGVVVSIAIAPSD